MRTIDAIIPQNAPGFLSSNHVKQDTEVDMKVSIWAWIGLTCFPLLDRKLQPKKNVNLKIDFENAFKLIHQQFMLEKTIEIHPEVSNDSHLAYSRPGFPFYCDSVLKFSEGTQKEILKLHVFSRIPFRIWLTAWSRK